jgi:hypothetical protein
MPTKSKTKRALIAYLVEPELSLRVKLHTAESNSPKEADLGFQGVFRILRSRRVIITKTRSTSHADDQIRSLALYRFSKDMFVLLADVEQAATLEAWKDLENPARKGFQEQLLSQYQERWKFIQAPAPIMYLVSNLSESQKQPEILVTDKYVSTQLATRLVITEAIERLLVSRVTDLAVGNYNLTKIHRILHATTQWHTAWSSSGSNVPKLVESYVKNFSKNVDFNKYYELLRLANNKEQRRLAWASGTAVAIGNLVASTVPADCYKWVAWPVFVLIFGTMYWAKPFTRL